MPDGQQDRKLLDPDWVPLIDMTEELRPGRPVTPATARRELDRLGVEYFKVAGMRWYSLSDARARIRKSRRRSAEP